MIYDAFISYSHAKDRPIAAALQSVMQSLGKTWWQRRKLRIFRDETSLTATPELWPTIEAALISSRFLVLMGSPEAAASNWVNREVTAWLDNKGPVDGPRTLLIVLTSGDLVWDQQSGDFDWRLASMVLPPALKGRWTSIEPLWIDLRSYRDETAKATRSNKDFATNAGKIAARILGTPLEDLLSDEVRNQRNALRLAVGASCLLFALAAAAGTFWYLAEQRQNRALIGQSKLLAKSARDYLAAPVPDPVTAVLLALEALPDPKRGVSRPYVPEAEHVLVDALGVLRERKVLAEHKGTVIHASFNRDGSRLVTSGQDGKAVIWDARSGQMLAHLVAGDGFMWGAAFSSDGKWIVTDSSDAVRLWDAKTGQQLNVVNPAPAKNAASSFSPDANHIVSIGRDGTARIWDIERQRDVAEIKDTKQVQYDHDGRRVIAISADGIARILDANNVGSDVPLITIETKASWASFSPNDTTILKVDDEGRASVVAAATGKVIATYHEPISSVAPCSFAPDGSKVVTSTVSGRLVIWDASDGRELRSLADNQLGPIPACFTPDGSMVLSAEGSGAALRDAETGDLLTRLVHPGFQVVHATASSDGTWVATSGSDGMVRLWDARRQLSTSGLHGHKGKVNSIDFSKDGRAIVTASDDGTVQIWSTATGRQVTTFSIANTDFREARFSLDGSFVAAVSGDLRTRVWDLRTGQLRQEFEMTANHDAAESSLAISPEGDRIITSYGGASYAAMWDMASGKRLGRFHDARLGEIRTVAFNHDGTKAVTASIEGYACIWDATRPIGAASNKGPICFRAHSFTYAAVFSPDGSRIATAGAEYNGEIPVAGTAKIWDAVTHQLILTLSGTNPGERPVFMSDVAFSPDGSRLVTRSTDGNVQIWDVKSGGKLLEVGKYAKAAFTGDGRQLALADEAAPWVVHFLPLHTNTQELVDHAKSVVPRCLSSFERLQLIGDQDVPDWCIEGEKWPYQDQSRKR